MDRRERYNNVLVATRALLHQERADMWTALPGVVQSFDPTKATVSVQPSIMAQFRYQNGPNEDENWKDISLPLLVDCPVFFPGGGPFVTTFPIQKGDEGGILFSSRCIDAWWQLGGTQKQLEFRMHDLSDGMFIPRLFSLPNIPANISTTDVQLRNLSGDTVIGIEPNKQVYINAPGGVTINGALTVTGPIIGGYGGADQVGLTTHVHPSNGSPPTPGT